MQLSIELYIPTLPRDSTYILCLNFSSCSLCDFSISVRGVDKNADVIIPSQELVTFRVCFHPRLLTIFLNTANEYADTIRKTCSMLTSDPTSNPDSQRKCN